MGRFALFGLCILIFTLSCKDSATVSQTQEESMIDTTENSEGSRIEMYQIYLVTVDNLRVREGEKKSSKVKDKLKEGTIVYSDGSVSSFTEKVTLRGVDYNSPYQKINYSGNTGWVYGGGLYKIYDAGKPDDFTASFDNLVLRLANARGNITDRGRGILNAVRSEKSGSKEWNDMMFFLTEFHLERIMKTDEFYSPFDSLRLSDEEYTAAANRTYDMQQSPLSKKYAAAGFKFSASEGMVDPIMDYLKIKNMIEGPFSNDVLTYLDIRIRESMVNMFSDAAIVCPLDVIVDHITAIEKLLARSPHFVRADRLSQDLNYLHYALLNGTANTPAKDYETGQINKEWLDSWGRYVASNPKGMILDEVKANLSKYTKS